MNEPPRAYMPLAMSQHNVSGFGESGEPMRVSRWQVAPTPAASSQPKSAPATYMPSLGTQVSPMQPLGFDYATVAAQQLRYPPPVPKQQDYYTPRYSDPAFMPTAGAPGSYGFPSDADQWATFQPMSTPLRSPPKKGKSQKKADGKQATFLTKLYAVLEDPEFHHIIRWDETGDLIIIERPEELAEKILPQVYRQTRFASFSRQLNIYGWMRKVSLRHVESGIVDPDASTWSHQTLRRDSSKDEIQGYKRRVPPRPSQAQKNANAARLQAETMSLSSDSDSFHSPPDAYSTHALGDLNETPVIDFAGNAVNPVLPTGGETVPALQAFNLESTGASIAPSVGPPEPVRRLSMPASTRPSLNFPHRPMHLKQHSMPVHGPSGLSASLSTAYPMPLSGNPLQMTDASSRTSAPNAPPPNMGFSPSTGMGTLWIDEASKDGDMLLRGTSDAPSYKVDDASTWARRGFGTLGDGLRPTEPAPLNPSSMPNSFQFGFTPMMNQVGVGQVFQPGLPGVGIGQQPLVGQAKPAPPLSPVPLQLPSTSASASAPAPATPATPTTAQGLPPSMAQTVSPGVYQSGFSIPVSNWISPRGTPSPTNMARGTATKSERRMSVTHPYSPPRARAPALGPMRHVGGRRDSLHVSVNSPDSLDHDGLPSASLAQPELFGELEEPDLE